MPRPRSTIPVLPRSQYGDLRAEVVASQRGRLLVAMADVVGEKGYAATAVADVLKAAGISRRTFYEHFSDKEACFLAAHEYGVEVMVREMLSRIEGIESWRERVEVALATFLGSLASEPGFARAFLVEVWAAGPAAYARHAEVLTRFHALLRGLHEMARADNPDIVPVSDVIIAAVTGGISRVATIHVLSGRTDELPDLLPEILRFGLPLLAGTDPQLQEVPR